MKLTKLSSAIICTLSIAGLSACSDGGGGDSATTSGSGVAGTITGFGSIIMNNGKEYGTDNVAGCDVDDLQSTGKCDDDLSVGMHVRFKTDINGNIISLRYDDELEGPATNVSGSNGDFTFEVFGVTVTTSNPETQWDDFASGMPTAAELEGAIVELSGDWQDGSLIATYVEKQDDNDTEFEVKGFVSNVSATGFTLTLRNGATITVIASENPVDGSFVEIEGDFLNNEFIATKVEEEDEDDFDDDESEVEITGLLVANNPGYSIGNTTVDISNAPSCTDQVDSVVEAEGVYNSDTGVLVVEECENEDEDLEMECDVSSISTIDPAMPKVGTIQCAFPNSGSVTVEFRNSPDLAMFSGDDSVDTFDLRDVNVGDCVEIKASIDDSSGTSVYVAGLIESEGSEACGEYELEGPVEAVGATSITAVGVTFVIDGDTELPNAMLPKVGDIVEIKDDEGDGIADALEIDEVDEQPELN
jgi:hypothetical protein